MPQKVQATRWHGRRAGSRSSKVAVPTTAVFLDWATLSCPPTVQLECAGHLELFFNSSREPISPGPRFIRSFNKKSLRVCFRCPGCAAVQHRLKTPTSWSLYASHDCSTDVIGESMISQEGGGHGQEPRAQRRRIAVRRVTDCLLVTWDFES